jgi:HK97 family phage portal protein
VRFASRVTAGLKAFALRFASSSRSWWSMQIGRSRFDYRREVGDGRGNSIVQSCILWFCRTFPEAPIRITTINAEGEEEEQANHALKLLLDTPNPYYSGELLWWGTLADWMLGNAYWLKIRSGAGRVVQLWWVPSTLIEPRWPADGSEFISHYDYRPGPLEPTRIDPADVVHFRYGLDPNNIRKGLSPLGSLLREVFTDDEAANYTASMLRNVGVPPVVISPGPDAKPTQAELEEVKTRYVETTTGDHRGEPVVMRGPTSVQVLGFDPQKMDMKTARRVPEERVSAIFGIPAVVAGLGAGLDRSTFANFAEAREAAYESNVIPSQRLLAAELRTQLLPDFGDVQRLRISFDLTKVRVLQADENALHARAREDLKSGLVKFNEARKMIGLPPVDGEVGDMVYVPINVAPTHVDQVLAPPVQAQPALPPVEPGQPAKVLPMPTRKERKAANGAGETLRRVRGRLQAHADAQTSRFLNNQQIRVLERLLGTPKAQADVPAAEDLITPAEEAALLAVLTAIHKAALSAVEPIVVELLGVAFALDEAQVREFLTDAGQNIRGIHETTLEAVRTALAEGTSQGETAVQIAERMRTLPEFNEARALTVARTELGSAINLAALHSYRASGVVVGVHVFDGDSDAACAEMNGRTFPLEQAPPPLQHPNCVRVLVPILDLADMEVAA